uniref:Uncharacterized protein n=1 Tax=Glossina brevipalpis TaxID=37001 RepID=A0A1A9WYY3_9MUSC
MVLAFSIVDKVLVDYKVNGEEGHRSGPLNNVLWSASPLAKRNAGGVAATHSIRFTGSKLIEFTLITCLFTHNNSPSVQKAFHEVTAADRDSETNIRGSALVTSSPFLCDGRIHSLKHILSSKECKRMQASQASQAGTFASVDTPPIPTLTLTTLLIFCISCCTLRILFYFYAFHPLSPLNIRTTHVQVQCYSHFLDGVGKPVIMRCQPKDDFDELCPAFLILSIQRPLVGRFSIRVLLDLIGMSVALWIYEFFVWSASVSLA